MPTTDIVLLSDVQTHLNWSAAEETKYATPMGRFISAATPVIEEVTGPIVQRAFNQWYSGGYKQLILRRRPVVSITSVTETSGSTTWTLTDQPVTAPVDGYGYTLNSDFGVLTRRSHGVEMPFADGTDNINVQYVAGYCADTAHVPPNIAEAALELIRINWQPPQAGNVPSFGGSSGIDTLDMNDGIKVGGWFIPNRVLVLLRPGPKRIGIA
jgi:hypothetical protein